MQSICQSWTRTIKLLSLVSPSRLLDLGQKGRCVKSGCSGALKLDRLGLGCKAYTCNDAGTGDLGVPTTDETSSGFFLCNAGSTRLG